MKTKYLKICDSYLIQKKVTGILFIGNKVISKNHYLNTFLWSYFLLKKRYQVIFLLTVVKLLC